LGNGPLPPQGGQPPAGPQSPMPPAPGGMMGGAQAPTGPIPPGQPVQGGPAAQSPQPDPSVQEQDPQAQLKAKINSMMMDANLAKKVQKKDGGEYIKKMGAKILEGIDADKKSMDPWLKKNEEWMNLALLVRENKSFPWPKAANVKYPLLATAAMQFSARAYPALVPSDGHVVKTKVVQMNGSDEVYNSAERIGHHMSYQVIERMPDWEEDMDKLLMTMAISGICFKKTYHNSVLGVHCSNLVYPENLIVNYHAKSLKKAYRVTEQLFYNDNEIKEKVLNDEEFLDVEYNTPVEDSSTNKSAHKKVATGVVSPPVDKSTPHTFYSCHTFWDLDDDGYEEPYIITIHKETKQVVRIIARWCLEDVHYSDKNKIARIEPMEYFTAFPFIPNPDGSIYALGFGLLLGPLNESVNALINQLMDAGTLANMPAGFIGKGLRLRMGQTSLQPGEFKVVNATGEDLQKSVYVMPFREPSSVLFQLMQMLITSGNQLASIAEIFVGKMPGQNTPATTTQETIQQGMAVFTAIYKRVYRSLAQEFKKIFWLNKINPDVIEEESKISGIQMQASDYDLPDWVVIPGADPTGDTGSTKLAKLQSVGQLLQLQTIDPMGYTRRVLDANEIPNAQQLMRQPSPPQPDPKMQTEQEKQKTEQLKQQGMTQSQQADAAKAMQDQQDAQQNLAITAQKHDMDLRHTQQMQALKLQGEQSKIHQNTVMTTLKEHQEVHKHLIASLKDISNHVQQLHQKQQTHVQGQVHAQQEHRQTLTLNAQRARQEARLKAKAPTTTK